MEERETRSPGLEYWSLYWLHWHPPFMVCQADHVHRSAIHKSSWSINGSVGTHPCEIWWEIWPFLHLSVATVTQQTESPADAPVLQHAFCNRTFILGICFLYSDLTLSICSTLPLKRDCAAVSSCSLSVTSGISRSFIHATAVGAWAASASSAFTQSSCYG